MFQGGQICVSLIGRFTEGAGVYPQGGVAVRLTTKGRYAVTAMLDLALHQGEGSIALADIADRQGISLSYLEQLFAKLRRRGLVVSARGPGGGYRLARPPQTIRVSEIIAAVDEGVDTTRCGGAGNCRGDGPCLTHDLWRELSEHIQGYLDQISLQTLIERHRHQAQHPATGGCVIVDVKLDGRRTSVEAASGA